MYNRPAEWHPHKTLWLAWPCAKNLWQHNLDGAQTEFLALLKSLDQEQLVILVPDQAELDKLSQKVPLRPGLSFKIMPYGDIWLRDTLPILVKDEAGEAYAVIPRFNGWGQKYLFKADNDLSSRVADEVAVPKLFSQVVFEGGAIECDGLGTLLTTEQCLLNKNRNPLLTKDAITKDFAINFGVKKIVWLKDGLKNDHTDGHIDTLARFVAPQKIVIMIPHDQSDPNYHILMAIKQELSLATDAQGKPFELYEIPSPGAVLNDEGELMPASYVNFIRGDHTVVVPLYGSPHDQEALKLLSSLFNEKVVGLSAKYLLTGGGAFHCISQEFYG